MKKKRANGQGTISRRKDGRWEIRIFMEDAGGVMRRKTVYARTNAEAREKLAELKVTRKQAQSPASDPGNGKKLGDYLNYWLESYVQVNKRPTTYEQYNSISRLYLKPFLGKRYLTELTVPIVQSFLNDQLNAGHSVRRVQQMKLVLSAALTRAMREELIYRNVARLVELPQSERGEIEPWTIDEARAFLKAATDDPFYPAFVLLVQYGLRRGEVMGLRWSDVNFEQGEIHIRQQIVRANHILNVGPVKTKAGRRDLPLLPLPRAVLTSRRNHQAAERVACGPRWGGKYGDLGLVFTTKHGSPHEPRNLVRSFKRICQTHGIREIKMHHIRHTTATLLKDLGVPARDAQFILGHASSWTTQQIYQHDNMATKRSQLVKLAGVLGSEDSGPVGASAEQNGAIECRQVGRQSRLYLEFLRSIYIGSEGQQGSWGLTFMRFRTIDFFERVAGVANVLNGAKRRWIVGAAAVKGAVKV